MNPRVVQFILAYIILVILGSACWAVVAAILAGLVLAFMASPSFWITFWLLMVLGAALYVLMKMAHISR